MVCLLASGSLIKMSPELSHGGSAPRACSVLIPGKVWPLHTVAASSFCSHASQQGLNPDTWAFGECSPPHPNSNRLSLTSLRHSNSGVGGTSARLKLNHFSHAEDLTQGLRRARHMLYSQAAPPNSDSVDCNHATSIQEILHNMLRYHAICDLCTDFWVWIERSFRVGFRIFSTNPAQSFLVFPVF